MRLAQKLAIITGGGSGFGAGIAAKFAAEGATVIVADINETAAQDVAMRIGGHWAGVDVAQEVLAEAQGAVLPLVTHLDSLRWILIALALAGI